MSVVIATTVTLIALVILVGIMTNLLVIGVIYKVPKLHKKESAFIVSMAVSDILQELATFSVEVALDTSIVSVNIFFGMLYYLSYTTSMFSVCGLSIVKYIRIKYTFRYQRIVTKNAVKISIFLVWVVPTVLYSSFFLVQIIFNQRACSNAIIDGILQSSFVIGIYLPALVMLYVYCRLYFCSRRHIRNLSQLAPGCPATNTNKTVRTIGVIMGSFIVCWMPKVLLEHIMMYGYFPDIFVPFLTLLSIIGPMVNAVVYIAMNDDFKGGLKRLLKIKPTPNISVM